MYILPICVTVYKIIAPTISPSLHTLAVVPFREINSNGIRLKVPHPALVVKFENLLRGNNYEIIDGSDPRMQTWCDISSKRGRKSDYQRKVKTLITSHGRKVKADNELDSFVEKYETSSVNMAKIVTNLRETDLCFNEIVAPADKEKKKLSDVQGVVCSADMITALMEVGRLRAEGRYSSVMSTLNKAKHSLDFDIPLKIENYVDFNGIKFDNKFNRLIGYQGELRLIEYRDSKDEVYDICNKFGDRNENKCMLSSFSYVFRENYLAVRLYQHKSKVLKLGKSIH